MRIRDYALLAIIMGGFIASLLSTIKRKGCTCGCSSTGCSKCDKSCSDSKIDIKFSKEKED